MIPKYRTQILEVKKALSKDEVNRTFKIDWENNRLLSKHIDGTDAIKQAIQVITAVEYKDWDVMPDWFGIEIKKYLGMPRYFVKANVERLIKEACSTDDRIEKMYDFNIEDLEHALYVSFKVDCKEGTFETEVVIEDG